jgi:hypothetical protein
MPANALRKALVLGALCLTLAVSACATQGQTGALAGAGVGALIGQAIGHSTGATLIGAGVGTGLGYIIGNEMDKSDAKQRQTARPEETQPLANTYWKVTSIVPMDQNRPFRSWQVHFRPDGTLLSSKQLPDGSVREQVERYRVVGSTLVINQDDYVINSRYRLDGRHLYVDTAEHSMVLERR